MTTIKEYLAFTRTTVIYPKEKAVEYLGLGLASEAGEVAGLIKKSIRDNTSSQELKQKLNKEIGDVLWYIVRLCDEYEIDIDQVVATNMSKLTKRKKSNTLSGSGDER